MPTWWWLGRPLAADLANAQLRIGDTDNFHDLFAEPAWLDGWLAAEKSRVGELEPGAAAARLDDFRRLRDAVREVLSAAVGDYSEPAVAVINEMATCVQTSTTLDIGPEGPALVEHADAGRPSDVVLARIARSAMALVAGEDRTRVRVCPASNCGSVYIAGRAQQRWCSDACGNRSRVARHASRARAGSEGPATTGTPTHVPEQVS